MVVGLVVSVWQGWAVDETPRSGDERADGRGLWMQGNAHGKGEGDIGGRELIQMADASRSCGAEIGSVVTVPVVHFLLLLRGKLRRYILHADSKSGLTACL